MDRLNQLRGATGGSGDSTLDTTSPPSEAFMTANDTSSKYFSLSEDDSTFDISPIKDVSLASTSADTERTITGADDLISNLSPISKKSDMLDSYKIGKQIEAANILSGGVDIFDDNENSYDGDELVIDDNVEIEEKSNPELKQNESVDFKNDDNLTESTLMDVETDIATKDTEVVLQIDGKNVDAIDIGNGLYLYRKEGQEELAAVQIVDDDQNQPSFKFLKVRENTEGNLEVYEEIEIEVPKEVPVKEGKSVDKNTSHVPVNDINKVINDPIVSTVADKKNKTPQKETTLPTDKVENEDKDISESKTELNLNGKMMKFSESRKSPVIGTFTPMTYHSTPNKEGIPLTKTMVDMHLQPSRHSDNVKKTIEVHTDSCKQKFNETSGKTKDISEEMKEAGISTIDKTKDFSDILKETGISITDKTKDFSEILREKRSNIQKVDSSTVADESKKQESDRIENESEKNDGDMEIKNNDNSIVTNENQETHDLITECGLGGMVAVNNEDSLDLVIDDSPKNKETTPKNVPDKHICDNVSVDTSLSKNSNNKNKELNVCGSVSTEIKCDKKVIEDNKKVSGVETHLDILTKPLKEDIKQGMVETEKEKDISLKTFNTCDGPNAQKEMKEDIIDLVTENKDEVVFDDKSCVALKPVNISTEISNEAGEELVDGKLSTISDSDPINLMLVSHVVEIEDEKNTDSKNEVAKKHEAEITKIVGEKTICNKDDIEQKIHPQTQVTGDVILGDKQQVDGIQSTINKTIETQLNEEEKEIPKDVANEKGPDIKELNLPNKEKENEVIPCTEKQIIKIACSASLANIPSPKVITVAKSKEIKMPSTDRKIVIANVQSEIILKPEIKNSNTIKPSITKTEITSNKVPVPTDSKKDIYKGNIIVDIKPTNNNNAAVPFGKWTEANRQEFLNKIKETKVPINISNSKPIKNSNDLNRRDVLKKIDSQRQSSTAASKAQESGKTNLKNEKVFTNKPINTAHEQKVQNVIHDSKIPMKVEATEVKTKAIANKKTAKQDINKSQVGSSTTISTITTTTTAKKEGVQRTAVNTQDLIDKTVEGMINKGYPTKLHTTDAKCIAPKDSNVQLNVDIYPSQPDAVPPTSLDAIEMKMNELHGIPFIERPPHELPRPNNTPFNNYTKIDKEKPADNKVTKIPNLVPFANKSVSKVKENVVEFDSEEEIIEHEPVTGDIDMTIKDLPSNPPFIQEMVAVGTCKISPDPSNKETIITENDFDKFARRNSVTYENCITVSFDRNEQHNVFQTVVEKDILKGHVKNDVSKPKLPHKSQSVHQNINPTKPQYVTKIPSVSEDTSNKNYQSKLQIAYQSALTAKRHKEGPITVIEDKPVKVVFVDANPEFIANKLNVEGQHLSPVKKPLEVDSGNTNESLDLDITESIDGKKLHDETKPKTKHQRKQVLTPVETPDLELIEPGDLGLQDSPKKKRKTEDVRVDKISKNLIHKKSYLLGRSAVVDDGVTKIVDITKSVIKDTMQRNEDVGNKDAVTAIDNLVKAAELLENQSESINKSNISTPDNLPSTPVKRGRGRPRKYPLPESTDDKAKAPSPQKKPRLIDAKPSKRDTTTEEEESSDEEIVKENWTMGKINENIVCPICNKLFRSENVVFKHVKHCTGPSPNRSDADKRSPRRGRQSKESDSKSEDMDIDEDVSKEIKKYSPKNRRSKDSSAKSDTDKEDIIVIEDTPVKEKYEKDDDRKHHESRKLTKTKIQNRIVNNLVCEFCGKTFRQLSYLAHHKLQHKKDDAKKHEKDVEVLKSVVSCEVCHKEFRKPHHLAQHRLIHNPQTVSSRQLRKSSSEQEETKCEKEESMKQNDDPSAGFRCEPCDKSFRKLHHLVEHRETHDGINRQKGTTTVQTAIEKATPTPQCEICKKTFRKLHHLIEHKEQHLDTSSEKSDDKSVKSSLSTKDIIHECPLCYMVFPNEHSLNKHSVICQRKKRQSKQPKPMTEEDSDTIEIDENSKSEENKLEDIDEPEIIAEEVEEDVKVIILEKNDEIEKKIDVTLPTKRNDKIEIIAKTLPGEIKDKAIEHQDSQKDDIEIKNSTPKVEMSESTEVKMKIEKKENEKFHDLPKKKTPAKIKVATIINKRQKLSTPEPENREKTPVETSDEDDVRYMLNPNLVVDETSEGKVFMKVRAKKRNSLQIERPNSKDLIKRRTSLQHPPKIPRLKLKPLEQKLTAPVSKTVTKTVKLEPMPSTDSDDSDVKYSFPKTSSEGPSLRDRPSKDMERNPQRKSMAEKRKSLGGIAKRKSLGKTAAVRHKRTTSPPKQIKRRTLEVEHRCDCGQLFGSGALLARHASLAHTPPRIRKRRSPPPPPPDHQPTTTKQALPPRKSSVKSDTSNLKATVATRKSTAKNDPKSDVRKSLKPVEKKVEPKNAKSNEKSRRSIVTRTTALPEKGKKPTSKSKI